MLNKKMKDLKNITSSKTAAENANEGNGGVDVISGDVMRSDFVRRKFLARNSPWLLQNLMVRFWWQNIV
jgi:hypothetical protein